MVASSIRNKEELGKKKMGEEKNREMRGWGRGRRRHQPPYVFWLDPPLPSRIIGYTILA